MIQAINSLDYLIGMKYIKKYTNKINTLYVFKSGAKNIFIDRTIIEITDNIKKAKEYASKGCLVGILKDGILVTIIGNKKNVSIKVDRFLRVNTRMSTGSYFNE